MALDTDYVKQQKDFEERRARSLARAEEEERLRKERAKLTPAEFVRMAELREEKMVEREEEKRIYKLAQAEKKAYKKQVNNFLNE